MFTHQEEKVQLGDKAMTKPCAMPDVVTSGGRNAQGASITAVLNEVPHYNTIAKQ